MSDQTTTTTTTTTPPWHAGLDPEVSGHIVNKGWDKLTPDKAAAEAVKSFREAEKFIGAPANELLRLPKDVKDEAGWKNVWSRLGAPSEAKDYDFTGVTVGGQPLDQRTSDFLRNAAFTNHLPKDAAKAVAAEYAKFLEGGKAAESADFTAKVAADTAQLDKNWGTQKEVNMFIAKQAVAKFGLKPEVVATLEGKLGYADTMEFFLNLGKRMGEDKYVAGTSGGDTSTMTVDQAIARKGDVMKDSQFRERALRGDPEAVRELQALDTIIVGSRMRDPNRAR